MKKFLFTVIAIVCICADSCSIPAKAPVEIPETQVVFFDEMTMEIIPESPHRSKKNADKIFDAWAVKTRISRVVHGRRLKFISPKEDGIHLMYVYQLPNVKENRVELIVPGKSKSKKPSR